MNFQKLFDDYNIPYSTKINRGWINVDCPYCVSQNPMHLGFNPSGNYCTCWNCGGHELKTTLSKILQIPRISVDGILDEYDDSMSVRQSLNKKTAKGKNLKLPTDGFIKAERKYLKSRGFSPRYLHEKYGIVGGGISGRWKFRIIIPIYYNGVLMSWTGRSILDKEMLKSLEIPRYKNLSIEESVANPKELFFNLDNCKGRNVVLTEGAFDVLRFDGNAICSLGTEMTESQIKLLSERFDRVFILFDNEPEAQEKARKFGRQLASVGVDVTVVDAYSDFGKNDMGDCDSDEIRQIKEYLNSLL